MRSHRLQRCFTVGAMILALPVMAWAQQEAFLLGTVTDSTGGALPGVVVVAVNDATGNTYQGRHERERRLSDGGPLGHL